MKRFILSLSVLLAIGVNGGLVWAQEDGAAKPDAPAVEDNRAASFLPPPESVLSGVQEEEVMGEDKSVTPSNVSETEAKPLPPVEAPKKLEAVDLAQPVDSKPLPQVDPETVGLLAPAQGGFGAAMWKGTPRVLVDRLLPAVGLPTESPTLNELAQRLLLSTAAVPVASETHKSAHTLMSMRIEKLISLGAVSEAWALAMLAQAASIDKVTMRYLVEAALTGTDRDAACSMIPKLMDKGKTQDVSADWQKALIVCKLQEGDQSAVQLGLDLLQEQRVEQDTFLSLVSRNVLARSTVLPRRLTPLNGLDVAVLQQLKLPLPPEVYARPSAAFIWPLLETKGEKEDRRLKLAEKAARQGLLSASQLGTVYKSVDVTAQNEISFKDVINRAKAYQEAMEEQDGKKRITLVQKFLAEAEPADLTGGLGLLAASLLEGMTPTADYNADSAYMARLMALAGRPEMAMLWYKQALEVRDRAPRVGAQMDRDWPIFVLSGLVEDGAFAQGLEAWLKQALAARDGLDPRRQRERAGYVLLMLSAAGYAVPDDAWLQVLMPSSAEKQVVASPLLLERLEQAGKSERKGETVLLALLVGAGGAAETPPRAMGEIIKALRHTGLKGEAMALAREATVPFLAD